jgi:hypothetical protein
MVRIFANCLSHNFKNFLKKFEKNLKDLIPTRKILKIGQFLVFLTKFWQKIKYSDLV